MAEYISRESALQIIDYAKQLVNEQIVRDSGAYELLSDTGKACYDGIITALAMCKRLINEAVIATEVQPVKHGYWTDLNNDAIFHYECSCCKEHTGWHEKYCPNCGARMDGDTECHDTK